MAAEAITFPDVEDLLRVHLLAASLGAGVAVSCGTRPNPLPTRLVHVVRTGGVRRDMVTDDAQVTVEAYSPTGGAALRLAQTVRAVLGALERDGDLGGHPVYEVGEYSGPYLNPDPGQPTLQRYSATYRVAVRGYVLT